MSRYQEERILNNVNNILYSKDSNQSGLLSILLLLYIKTFKEWMNKQASIPIASIKD